jgi:hypothetical protein
MKRALVVVAAAMVCHMQAPAQDGLRYLQCKGTLQQGAAGPVPWNEVVTIDPAHFWISWRQLKVVPLETTPTNFIANESQGDGRISVNVDRRTGQFEAAFRGSSGAALWLIRAGCQPMSAPKA